MHYLRFKLQGVPVVAQLILKLKKQSKILGYINRDALLCR
jgi:hypothetical protein